MSDSTKSANDKPANDKSANGKPTNDSPAEVVPLRRPRKCPICGQPAQQKWCPFCSKRCADIDLHRWLSGQYAIPGEERPAQPDSREDD